MHTERDRQIHIEVEKHTHKQVLIKRKNKENTKSCKLAPLIQKLLHGFTPDTKALNYSVGLLSTLTSKHPNMMTALQDYPWMMTGSGKLPSVVSVRKPPEIISLEGWGSLWRGLRSGVVRDSVFSGFFFGTWQSLHRAMLDWKAVGMHPEPRYRRLYPRCHS